MAWGFKSEGNRTVISQDGVARVAINEDGSMELLTPAANPTGNDVPTVGQLPFVKEYVSTEQTITAGATVTLAHGLGAAPRLVEAYLVCKTAEQGYSVGEVINCKPLAAAGTGGGTFNYSTSSDATNVYALCGSNGLAWPSRSASGAYNGLTAANWRLIVRAWA